MLTILTIQRPHILMFHKNSVTLFNILYKNTQNGLFLDREHRRFLEGIKGVLALEDMSSIWIKN